jgi:hypothetical protein
MNIVTIVKDWFGLLAVVIGLVSAIGFSVSTPWPARADVDAIQQQVIDAQRQIQQQGCLILRVLLRGYQEDLDRAEDELRTSPNSPSARRNKVEAETGIADITTQMRRQNCL